MQFSDSISSLPSCTSRSTDCYELWRWVDIISLLPHLALILTDIIAKLPDYVSRINGFALFQILNNFLVEFLPQTARGRGRVRDAKGRLVSTAVLGTLALLPTWDWSEYGGQKTAATGKFRVLGGLNYHVNIKIYTHTHTIIYSKGYMQISHCSQK